MAQTSGIVQRLKWSTASDVVYAFLGPTTSTSQAFILPFDPGDASVLASRRAMSGLLARAQVTGMPVTVTHPSGRTEIEQVDLRYALVRVDAIEVTQAIQNLTHTVPLVALKPTIVRVYLSSKLPASATVQGVLSVRRAGGSWRNVASLNSATLIPASFGQLNTLRNDAGRSLNFRLPTDQTAAGELEVRVLSITDAGSGAPIAFNPPGSIDTFEFTPAAPMRLAVVGFSYQQGGTTFTPNATDFGLLTSWLRRAYPVATVIASQQVVASTSAVPFGCGAINAELAAIRALDVAAGVDDRTHYYAIVADGGFFMRGCATIAFSADPSAVGSGPTGAGSWGWDFDGTFGDWYGGHELGHTFGRLHPGFCGESNDDSSYPFTAGQLANADGSYAGFDVGDMAWGLPLTALPGTQWHDVMTYCNRQWLSSYTYAAIRARLAAENALGSGQGSGGSGRPDDRFPKGVERAERAARRAGQVASERTLVSIVANVNLTRREARIAYVQPVERGVPTEPDPSGPVLLRAIGPRGRVVGELPAAVKRLSTEAIGADEEALLDVIMAVDPSTEAIELWLLGELADTYRPPAAEGRGARKRAGPEVRALRADRDAEAAGRGLHLSWEAPEGGGLTYSVQVSRDRGRTWRTVAVGLRSPETTVDATNLPQDGAALFRVTATDGFRSTTSVIEWPPAGPEPS